MKINKNFKYYRSLVDIICLNVENRFPTQLTDTFVLIAAISYSFFKTNWIKNYIKKEIAINKLKKAVNEFSKSFFNVSCIPELNYNKNQSNYVLNNFFF
jgi:hypothetical protein